ncbi:hypothetical protein HPB52_007047 [Rhipicephalus sanguineus]|uniref:Uncharacterized protein n=1 Tax=Rhipicephalus sanguineus TaxID=34632 RepID=A0A9D4SVU3_RHISA|nr:hypothetical protein HPB52_007047 [Rhipicephalus sanguineus]
MSRRSDPSVENAKKHVGVSLDHDQSRFLERLSPRALMTQPETKELDSAEPDDKSPRADAEESPIAVECLHAYVQHERRIHQLERRRTLQCYQIKLDQLRQLEVAATNLENERQRLAQKMAAVNSLFNDGEAVTVRNELLRQKEGDGALHPDQEEYLDDVNRMEVCNNELKATEKQIEVIRKEVQELSNDCEELAQLYQDRDNLLDTIISKTSGSELECQLALDLEKLNICKQQVDLTHFKWSQALLMAVTYIFTDMKAPERREHAFNCYNSAYRRAGALKQWLEMVINNIIYHDLGILEERCREKSALLRKERIRLIKDSIKSTTGKEIKLDGVDYNMDADTDTFQDDDTAQLFYAERALKLNRDSRRRPDNAANAGANV